MAIRRRRANRKRAPRRMRGKRSGRGGVKTRGITTSKDQICKVVETIPLQDLAANSVYDNFVTLMDFERARYLSAGFQYYKCAKLTYTYEALYNTFQEAAITGGIVGDTVPYMYVTMNRTGDINVPNSLRSMQGMGAKPFKFTKTHKVSYKPNWNTPGLPVVTSNTVTGAAGPTYMAGSQICYNWIENSNSQQRTNVPTGDPAVQQDITGVLIHSTATNFPSDVGLGIGTIANNIPSAAHCVVYNGHSTYHDQRSTTTDTPVARVTVTAEWHFKKPIWNYKISQSVNTGEA